MRSVVISAERIYGSVWSILTQGKRGYSNHPETMRWKGKLHALYLRHEALVKEMASRRYRHQSPLAAQLASGKAKQDAYVDSYEEQVEILRRKACGCNVK